MITMRRRPLWPLLLVATVGACATLPQIAALRQVSFFLAGVQDARLAGVPLNRIASYRDLTATEVGRLGLAIARNDLPFEFRVDVQAENPAENRTTATMVRLTWALLLDDKETINSVLDTSHVLPPGRPVIIPVRMRLNLREFFSGPAESLVNLAAGATTAMMRGGA